MSFFYAHMQSRTELACPALAQGAGERSTASNATEKERSEFEVRVCICAERD